MSDAGRALTPGDVKVVWPTPEQIARAVFVAAALEGQDPLDVLQGAGSARARAYAAVALAHQFPTAPRAALSRKCGNDTCLANFRSGLKTGTLKWFDLVRLNAVRTMLGWSSMTMDEVRDAPLIYCGRSWEEFVDRGLGRTPSTFPDSASPVAGSGGGDEPAPNVETAAACGGAELAPNQAETTPKAPKMLAAPEAPKPEESKRVVAVERMKAWAIGDAPVVKDSLTVDAAPQIATAPIPNIEPMNSRAALRGLEKVADCDESASGARREPAQSETHPVREPTLPAPDHVGRIAKPLSQRVTPPAQVTAPSRRALNNAPPASGKPLFAPAPPNTRNEIADTRRPTNELQGRLLTESMRGVTSFRPDPPAEKRGAVNVTAQLMGDPAPSRLRTDQIDAMERRR